MRYLSTLLLFFVSPLFAQGNVVVDTDITATAPKGIVSVSILCNDTQLGNFVQFALSSHGAMKVSAVATVKVRITRTALSAVVACDHAAYNFTTQVEAKDENELALKAADAAIVGLGRRWQLKALYADTKIAFVSRLTGSAEIYVTNLARSKTLRLTNYRNTSIGPRWAADGKSLYFVSSFRNGWPEIFSTDGLSEVTNIVVNVRGALGAASSGPDGRIAFASSNKETMDIYVAGAKGQVPTRVIKAPNKQWVNTDPAWSPDGSQFALTGGPSGRPGIYLANTSGGTLRAVSTGYNYSTEPRWNPIFANQLVFTYQSGSLRLAILDLVSSSVKPINTSGTASLSHASWCADGRHLVATHGDGLAVVDSISGKVTRLTPPSLGRCSEPDCWTRKTP